MNRAGTTRISSALAHLQAARGRPNLTIRADATVDRLLISDRRAVGVQLTSGEEVRAHRTVPEAGSLGSAAILMRSGIGPASDLAALGIPPVIDRPAIGEHLFDHAAVRNGTPSQTRRPPPGLC